MSKRLAAVGLGALLSMAGAASAQHAGFTLFGPPSSRAAKVPAEQKFVHPVTSPYFHEDSFITTDARAWFLYHDFPSDYLGGDAQVYALQARLALTDTLQLVAYKDGYTVLDSAIDEDGWNDVAAGLKWNFLQDWDNQLHAAVGVGYEFPWGDQKVLQNNGEVRIWGSLNKGFGKLHLGGTVNFFIGTSDDEPLGNSDYMSWHLHLDYYLCNWFSPVVEFNGYHVLNKEDEAVPFSAIDVSNIGGGDAVVTMGVGGEIRPMDKVAVRAAFEFPLTDADDLYGWRATASLIFSF